MNLKLQLKILSFLQFCLWGSWLTTLGSYMFVTLKFDGASIGAVYSSLGIAAVFMPALLGIVADKQFAKRNCDVDNIFAPEHRQGRLMELSAAVGFLRGIHFIKITARFRRGMAGRQRLINIGC